MKLGPVTKLEKKNTAISKKFWRWRYIGICDVIVIFGTYGQFGAIRKSESGRIICKTYIFINRNLFSLTRNWKQNQRISNIALILMLWLKVLFFTKNADICKKRKSRYWKVMNKLLHIFTFTLFTRISFNK